MKEYLDPKDWSLKRIKLLLDRVPSNWIEVPDWALFYARQPAGQFFYRRDERGRLEFWSQLCKTWFKSECPEIHLKPLWVRPTKPEELPFADDEPPAYYGNAIRPKPRQRVYAVMGDNVPEQQQIIINGIDYTKAIQLGVKLLQLAIRTLSEAMKQK